MSRLTTLFILLSLLPLTLPSALPQPGPSMQEVPTVDYCHLIQNPDAYDQKVIRVHAKYKVGAKWSNLQSPHCGSPKTTWVNFDETNFDESFQPCQKSNIAEAIKFKGFDQVFDVVLVGKFFGGYSNGPSSFMFVVGCVEDSKLVESSETKVPIVSYCELAQNPSRYDKRVIRVQGVYKTGFEASSFDGSGCNGVKEEERTWVYFDELYKTCTSKEVQKAFDDFMGQGDPTSMTERLKAAVILLGYFEVSPNYTSVNNRPRNGFGHLEQYKNQFTAKCLEQVEALPVQ